MIMARSGWEMMLFFFFFLVSQCSLGDARHPATLGNISVLVKPPAIIGRVVSELAQKGGGGRTPPFDPSFQRSFMSSTNCRVSILGTIPLLFGIASHSNIGTRRDYSCPGRLVVRSTKVIFGPTPLHRMVAACARWPCRDIVYVI
jgi:hypothetical protein